MHIYLKPSWMPICPHLTGSSLFWTANSKWMAPLNKIDRKKIKLCCIHSFFRIQKMMISIWTCRKPCCISVRRIVSSATSRLTGYLVPLQRPYSHNRASQCRSVAWCFTVSYHRSENIGRHGIFFMQVISWPGLTPVWHKICTLWK